MVNRPFVCAFFVLLFFGLWPKDFLFSNGVSRVEDQAGIRFKKYGITYTDPIKEFHKEGDFGENGFSIEIALKPSSSQEGFNFILTLHNGNDGSQLLLGQWRSWLIAMNGDDYDHKRRVKTISVNSASMSPEIHFITLTTGKDGTNFYFNGRLVKSTKDLTLQIPYGDKTRLILGNSQYGRHSWRGDVYGQPDHRNRSSLDAVPQFVAAGFTVQWRGAGIGIFVAHWALRPRK